MIALYMPSCTHANSQHSLLRFVCKHFVKTGGLQRIECLAPIENKPLVSQVMRKFFAPWNIFIFVFATGIFPFHFLLHEK